MSINHIYIIGDEKREPERITYLKNYFKDQENITYFQPTYKDNIKQEEIDKYIPNNWSLHNRPLRLSEISLFLNYIYLFEKILKDHKEGYFLILESDVLFLADCNKYVENILPRIIENKIDCVSIGSGCNLIPPGIKTDSVEFQFVKMIKTRCTDSLIFSYNAIQRLYDYIQSFLESGISLNQPIDNFLETFFAFNIDYLFTWVYPPLCIQGSQNGNYKSSIQE